jgi:Family of unknown function (DUF6056)
MKRAFLANRFVNALFVSTSLAVIIPALALIYFAEPMGDDFVRALFVDVPHEVGRFYFHLSGRWAATGLEAFLLSKLQMLSVYSGILWGLQVVHFLALLSFLQMVVGESVSLRGRLSLALGFFAFLLTGYPSAGQTVYWVNGGIEYQLPVSLTCLMVAALCSSTQSPLRLSRALPRALGLGLLGFMITGLHELAAVMLLGVLCAGIIFVLVERRPNLGMWLSVLFFVALGTTFTALAPGNAERAAWDFPHGRSVSQAILPLGKLVMRIVRWIDVRLLAASVLLALAFGSQLRESHNPSDRARTRTWAIPLVGATMLLGSCAALAYITGGIGPPRSGNFLYMTFCIAWFTSLLTFLKTAPGLCYSLDNSLMRSGRNVAVVFFCVSLLDSINHGMATRDLLFYAAPWRRAIAHRYELVRQSAKLEGAAADVVIPAVVHPVTFNRDLDIGPDPNFWANRAFARYFGVRSVRVGDW